VLTLAARAHAAHGVAEAGRSPVKHGTLAPVPVQDPLDQRFGLPSAGRLLPVLLEGETPAGRQRSARLSIVLHQGERWAGRRRGAELLCDELKLGGISPDHVSHLQCKS